MKNNKVAIILGFYDGYKYIDEQLVSILEQTHKELTIFIFDDNSPQKFNLKNLKINYQPKKIRVINRVENLGFAKNFLYGLKEIQNDFDFYAFSDQDDIWENNKIAIALKSLENKNLNVPTLYCNRTKYYNSDCSKEIGSSKKFNREKLFRNALLQNIAGGNTIVMNKMSKILISNSLFSENYVSHDWWCYQFITAAGGKIIYSNDQTLKYRQHEDNVIGMNNQLSKKVIRFKKFYSGEFKRWCDINIKNLYLNKKNITKKNLITLQYFSNARESKNIFMKLKYFFKSGVYRQSLSENLIFIFGLLLDKV